MAVSATGRVSRVDADGPVVVGRGAVSCFGAGHDVLLAGIFEGASGVRPLERLAGTDCLTAVAGEVPGELLRAAGNEVELPFELALSAAREALADASIELGARSGLILASTKGELSGIIAPGRGFGSPAYLLDRIATALECTGRTAAVSSACASGLSALALAGRWLRAGLVEDVLVVGVDGLSEFILRGFSGLLALDPGRARPFDVDRRGLSVGEAAAAIVLTSRSEDGPRLAGWGESNDANHVTGPSRGGEGLALAIERALQSAQLAPDAIDYVHAHATGTRYNDSMETKSIARVFAEPPLVSGTKAQTGHTLGAAGVLESLITLAALERGVAPANHGLTRPDPELSIPVQHDDWTLPRARAAVKLAAGFGGIDAAVVFTR